MCKQTEDSPFFSDKLWPLLYFFGSVNRSYLSIKKEEKKKASFPFVAWCMINTVSKNHIPICNIERGVANQPGNQRLGWPGSYS